MIAIEIKGKIKTFNNIPETWNNVIGYNYSESSVHYKDGFRKVIEPTYNSETQYKGVLIFDSKLDVFTYEVINYTVEQITSNLTAKEDVEDKTDLGTLEFKGKNLYEKTKNRLIRRNKKGLITKLRAKKVREILHPTFLLLKTGDIDLANEKAILIAVNSVVDVEKELVWFKAELQNLLLDVNNLL